MPLIRVRVRIRDEIRFGFRIRVKIESRGLCISNRDTNPVRLRVMLKVPLHQT